MFNMPTINDQITVGLEKEITHTNVHFKVGITGKDGDRRVYNWDSMIDKYRDILMAETILVELTDEEMLKYKFQPRRYCQDIYSNVDAWSILLRINNMKTSVDFRQKVFRTFGSNFMDILKEIMMIEDDRFIESKISAKKLE